MGQKTESDRHCYKCDSYHPQSEGTLCRDSRGRRRFVCSKCLVFVPKLLEKRSVRAGATNINT